MAIKKFEKVKSFEDVEKVIQDLRDNLSLQDIRAGDVRTIAQTTDTLDKTRYAIVEESGVPVIYYRNTSGTIYKTTMVAA